MKTKMSNKKLSLMFAVGILGCIFMGASDYLMIYGDTSFKGELAWLTLGVANISPFRNALSLFMAFPAVILYAVGLFSFCEMFKKNKYKKNFGFFTAIGFTPWLCLHLFYIMILFAFSFMIKSGEESMAYVLCENMFSQFSFVIILGEIIMMLPFLYIFIEILKGNTLMPKYMAVNNPLFLYAVLKIITLAMPDTAFRLAFTNGLMSEAMLLWFLVLIIFMPKYRKEK